MRKDISVSASARAAMLLLAAISLCGQRESLYAQDAGYGEAASGLPDAGATQTVYEPDGQDRSSLGLPTLGGLVIRPEQFSPAAPESDRRIELCNALSAYPQPMGWSLMPKGLIYRSYLAGAKESRFRSAFYEDQGKGTVWDISLGGDVSLLRHGTRGHARPEGFEVGIEGAGLLRLDPDESQEVMAVDLRFGVPVSWGNRVYQTKLAYYHLSSHLGDEFLLKNPGFVRLNYVRDAIVWGHSYYPFETIRLYLELAYAFNVDIAEPWEYQFGVEWAPTVTGMRGAPFAAVGVHLREEVDFGGNVVVQLGWAWRGSPSSGLLRIGAEYYNGKNDQFSFFNDSAQKAGAAIWYDY